MPSIFFFSGPASLAKFCHGSLYVLGAEGADQFGLGKSCLRESLDGIRFYSIAAESRRVTPLAQRPKGIGRQLLHRWEEYALSWVSGSQLKLPTEFFWNNPNFSSFLAFWYGKISRFIFLVSYLELAISLRSPDYLYLGMVFSNPSLGPGGILYSDLWLSLLGSGAHQ